MLSACFASAQSQKVAFSLFSGEEECALIPKQIVLSRVVNGKDSLVQKDTFSLCLQEIEFPKLAGTYKLVIRAQKYEDLNLTFDITDQSPEHIDLRLFELQKKKSQLDEVTITGIQRSFIQVDADKTTITVKDNPILTVSSVYDAILKIPGVVPYPGGGFTVGGKSASVYFEGIPGSLGGDDLTNLLKSLPATSVEKIEIISNPGASYDANVSGAIINVVSLSGTSKWISGTITLNYGVNANNKALPSLVISGKTIRFSWQLQTGYSYFERSFRSVNTRDFTTFNPLVQLSTDRREKNTNGFFYVKPSLNYKLNRHTNLVLMYNGSLSHGVNRGTGVSSSQELSPAVNLSNSYRLKSAAANGEFSVKYRNRLDTLNRVLEVTAFYGNFSRNQLTQSTQIQEAENRYSLLDYGLKLQNIYIKSDLEIPFDKLKLYLKAGAKYRKLWVGSLGKYNLESTTDAIFQDPAYQLALKFDYTEDNLAGYVEMKKEIRKLGLGAGLRVENFNLDGRSTATAASKNNYFNFFPSGNAIYRFSPDMNLIATYSRKISIPSYGQFDPNNSGYYDNYSASAGNLLLQPNFYNNLEMKFSVFDYLQLSVDFSNAPTLNLFELTVQPNTLQTVQTYKTYHNVNSLTYFLSIPVPFGLFREGMQFFEKAIDIDQISFLYLYAERTKTSVSGINYIDPNKAVWNYGVYSQFMLPFRIRMNVDYYFGSKGMSQIYYFTRPRPALEVVFTKDFLKKKLKTSLSFEDIFNTSQTNLRSAYANLNLVHYSKEDTRIIWIKLSYAFGKYEKATADPDFGKGGQGVSPNEGLAK
jgi:iron complex outermembrane receptor protein